MPRSQTLGCHLQLLLLEHFRVWGIKDVISQLGLAVNVDRRGGFAAQEPTEDVPGPVGQLWEQGHLASGAFPHSCCCAVPPPLHSSGGNQGPLSRPRNTLPLLWSLSGGI